MNFTQDEIAAVIGAKELEIIYLRRQLAQEQAKVAALTPKPVKQKKPNPPKEGADGAA